jgi:hypothetical protein
MNRNFQLYSRQVFIELFCPSELETDKDNQRKRKRQDVVASSKCARWDDGITSLEEIKDENGHLYAPTLYQENSNHIRRPSREQNCQSLEL